MPTTGFISFRHSLATFGAVLLIGAGVAGCGGGGDEEEPPPPTTATTGATETISLTTDELISEGDAICAEVNAAIGSIDASTADETTKADSRADLYAGVAERLTELGTPSDGDAPTEVIAAAEDLADGSTDVTTFQTAATDYGFTECSDAPSMPTIPTDPGVDSGTETVPDETYVPPTTEVPTEPAPVAPPSTGGGVAPTPAPTPTPAPSTGGSSSGGIGPG